jgi:hypothetical protein
MEAEGVLVKPGLDSAGKEKRVIAAASLFGGSLLTSM